MDFATQLEVIREVESSMITNQQGHAALIEGLHSYLAEVIDNFLGKYNNTYAVIQDLNEELNNSIEK